ncbi:NAD(P)-dependent oxidoreductase [Halobacillus seohaensis]|uniref:NAD(P)-dependent oxidoreductase n=1 Tax=Halobacillus seohaensis TaxID=447421 RepID=A0ABW2ENK8_9BACI
MKIAIFGATGRVGSRVTQFALAEGHEVQALVRNKEEAKRVIGKAVLIEGDATNKESIEQTLQGCDLVFSALSTDKTFTLSQATPLIIDGMNEHGINRIITVGTAGILNSRFEKDKYRFQSGESKRRSTFAAEEHAKVYTLLVKSTLDWVILCPTYLPDGESKGLVRHEEIFLPLDGKKITVEDTALFAFKELINPGYQNTRVGLSY